MNYRYAVSFESDTAPVDTHRGEVEAADVADAVKRAVFRAESARPNKRLRFRSVCVVLEELAAVSEKTANKIKGSRAEADAPVDSGAGGDA